MDVCMTGASATTVNVVVAAVILAVPLAAAVYYHWQTYTMYKLVQARIGRISYYWFSFQFQSEWLARQLPGYRNYAEALPDEIKARFTQARRKTARSVAVIFFWFLCVVPLLLLAVHLIESRL